MNIEVSAQVNIIIRDTFQKEGKNVTIPIDVSELSGYNIQKYEFKLLYDTKILKAKKIKDSETLTDKKSWKVNKNIENDNIIVNAKGEIPLDGSGTIIMIEFEVIGKEGYSPLTFDYFVFNEGLPYSVLYNGEFWVLNEKKIEFSSIGEGEGKFKIDDRIHDFPVDIKLIKGRTYEIEALPDDKSVFLKWIGDVDTENNPLSYIVYKDEKIECEFGFKYFEINISINPSIAGTVSGIGKYKHGEDAILEAIPNYGWSFIGWFINGDLISNELIHSLVVNSDILIEAKFEKKVYNLDAIINPLEAGNVSGIGKYKHGEDAILEAIPNYGWSFIGWFINGDLISNELIHSLVVNSDILVEAKFEKKVYNLDVIINPLEAGNVSGIQNYKHGENVILEAVPNYGWSFIGWFINGDLISNELTYSFILYSDILVEAKFEKKIYSLNIVINPIEGGTASGGGYYYYQDMAALIANSSDGWGFKSWSINGSELSKSPSMEFKVKDNTNLTANFDRLLYSLSLSANPLDGGILYGGGYYYYDQLATISAHPNKGWIFNYWSDEDSIYSYDSLVNIVIYNELNLTANFSLLTSSDENHTGKIVWFMSDPYPNPFNPTTTIKYSIPKQTDVTLKVFDVLGSEVATLVNKVQTLGKYEVEFDGIELTSGIYIYRLQADEFVETKKMILIK